MVQVACGLGVCGRYMFILELSDSEHEPKEPWRRETSRQSSSRRSGSHKEGPPALTNSHAITFRGDPQS